MSEAGDLFLDLVRAAYDGGLTGRQFRPHASIVLAELGSHAGLKKAKPGDGALR